MGNLRKYSVDAQNLLSNIEKMDIKTGGTYKFNTAKSKYQGQGAGDKEKERLYN